MDQQLRSSIQSVTFFYFMIVTAITTVAQLTTMCVIMFADISGKESVVAASVIGPALLGSFGIIRILTNMQHLVADMDGDMRATNYGTAIQGIPFGILKLVFAAIFLAIAIVQLNGIY
tara:strand:- start:610 stop:963 length:354 start_codon:yes stop_codon:yes gene_type:complete